MAVTLSPQSSPISSTKLVTDADSNGTAESNVTGASTVIYMVEVDNTANGADTYTKLWNSASPTVGTTAPDVILKTAASVLRTYVFPEGMAFGTALSMASVTTAGTAGTTSPSSTVVLRVVCT